MLARIPETVDEVKTLFKKVESKPAEVAELAVAILCVYPKDADLCFEMLNAIKGPNPLTPYEKSFIRDRFMDGKDYVPRSYFAGATPENDYKPSFPLRLMIDNSKKSAEQDGYITLYILSSGADFARQIKLRHKPSTNQWFLWDHMLLSDIKKPKSLDEWA